MRRVGISIVFVLAAAIPAGGATITVDRRGGADHADIQCAIDAAAGGDTVLVMPGEYGIAEPIDFNRLHDPGDPGSPPAKDIIVRSAGGAEVTTIAMAETPEDPGRSSVVLFRSGETAASVLDGFTLRGGRGTTSPIVDVWLFGGGVHCAGASPTIRSCDIRGNSARSIGYQPGACGYGGGIYCGPGSFPILTGCTIRDNSAGLGGGAYCGGSPRFIACTIRENSAEEGGGLICEGGGSADLTGCRIVGNSAHRGGGLSCRDASPALVNCVIAGNLAFEHYVPVGSGPGTGYMDSPGYLSGGEGLLSGGGGGGLDPGIGGGLLSGPGSSPVLAHCTVAENRSEGWAEGEGQGGGVACEDAAPILKSCILWANVPEPACGTLAGCLTDRDPLFVTPGHWEDCESASGEGCRVERWDENGQPAAWRRWAFDYRLRPGSPAIDAAPSGGAPSSDLEGLGRPCGKAADIGAYESGGCPGPEIPFRRGDADADGSVDLSDAIATLDHLFIGTGTIPCEEAADANDDGAVDISDGVFLLGHLFLGGKAPKEPSGNCGMDPTPDGLTCSRFPICP